MRTATYQLLRSIVSDETGIELEDGKHSLVQTRLLPIARGHGLRSVDELCGRLQSDHGLRSEVIDAMTTNETMFFRDPAVFDGLVTRVLPELLQQRQDTRTLRIWSAACSTGQEPYSVAMLLHEHFPELAGWDVQILATDLSRSVLARAKEARFRRVDVRRGLERRHLDAYFDEDHDLWTLKPHLRNRVEFRPLNLTAPWSRLPVFDVILLRNVLIYFPLEVRRRVLARAARQLADDGYLFLGASETPPAEDGGWRRISLRRGGCYQRSA